MIFEALDQEIINIKGIGKQKSDELNEMGILTIRDLFFHFPTRYEDYQVKDLRDVNHGDKITIEGTIYSEPLFKRLHGKKNILSVKVVVDSFIVTASWFNRPFLKNQLRIGRPILLTGKWDRARLQITVATQEFLDSAQTSKKGHLLPVYSLPTGFSQNNYRKYLIQGLQQYYHGINDFLPLEIIEKYKLFTLREAIKGIHFPKDPIEGKQARRRLIYDELLLYQLRLQYLKKSYRQSFIGIERKIDKEKVEQFIGKLPYALTDAQNRVVNEVLSDMGKNLAMNRLLQGDVGTGKTVVAAIGLYANYLSGYQGALMVPTEILAEQHYESLKEQFSKLDIEVGLLTGKLTEKEKNGINGQLQMGLIDIVIGTHALIQEGVHFKQLGLVITDEQHRFGVEQRAVLRKKGNEQTPDVLYMTATPIPRTLAITAFGDMEVSTLDQYPAGRKQIKTHWIKPSQMVNVLEFIENEIGKGRQAYVIAPLIEESEKLDVQNAIDLHAYLSDYFKQFQVGLLHGRMRPKEKEEVMLQFVNNELQVLISTTVIEVGVNVPNATVMVINDADRFGLAQLHQLRGRVGRGEHQSYCILIADPKSETGKERMRIMEATNDGFEIARRDLEIRGPGDFFGVKQSGIPDFKLADLVENYRTLEVARNDASRLIFNNDFWSDEKWEGLRKELKRVGAFQDEILDT